MTNLFRHRASWAIYDQTLVSGSNFVTTLIVARMLVPESFAMFSLASLVILFLASFQRTLITQPLNVLGATEHPSQLAARYVGLMRMQWLMISFGIVLLTVTGIFFFHDLGLLIGAASYLAGFFLQEMVRRYHYTQGEIQAALVNDLISYGGQLIVLLLLFAIGCRDAAYAFIALAATSLLAFVWGQKKIRQSYAALRIEEKSPKHLLVEHWNFAKWVVLSQFVFWGATQVYPFMLAGQSTYAAVADFNVANSILNALNIVRLMLGNYLPSRITVVYADGGTVALRKFLLRILTYSGGASLVFILFLMTGSHWLVDVLFAGKYPLAGDLIGWLACAHFASIIGVITNAGGLALRSTNWIFYSNAVGAAFSIVCGPFLIERYGVWGAVAGLCIASALPTVIQGIQVFYRCRLSNNVQQN
jgi:O-antigen/teichoic acid export membrane protein